MTSATPLLIVGAGPFGLTLAAQVQHLGLGYRIVGRPMEFWNPHMPRGMYLRSACDWHLDPLGVHTIDAYLKTRGLTPAEVEPLSLDLYRDYVEWFRVAKGIEPEGSYVRRLDADPSGGGFVALLDTGEEVAARSVVLAIGFAYFRRIPDELAARIPPGRFAHTCDLVDFEPLAGRRCLIVGGRQSAFEWATLISEAGASEVHVVYRHATPAFIPSDWSWVTPLVDHIAKDPGWYRALSDDEKKAINQRMWGEGRLKLEPWLAPRLDRAGIHLWPNTTLERCTEESGGEILAILSDGTTIGVDQVILATGYQVDLGRVPFLAEGNLLPRIETKAGFPVLDDHFQTSLQGLYATSLMATQEFGSFFGFTVSVRTSALVIATALQNDLSSSCL